MENLDFTELTPYEMKQVKGGNWVDEVEKIVNAIGIDAAAAFLGMTVQQVRDLLGL
ncbi:hypothetical protein BSF41_04920 [Flavobacterium sp. ACN2]|jgi:hypothetical protein|uniref:hypothetical protein n=1 Tax=unclassified Flavobacterium TaxID=196869 RepID=UPI001553FA75|nr:MULTISPECIES: hypothetical protein [unclassified Flavobacterium]MDY0987718.1 hypothetical protein [Flavobacterium sp. CFBP9031]PBI93412.1 hypothetical protein BSF41_04920 [Flavobacterium sp. ACN2]